MLGIVGSLTMVVAAAAQEHHHEEHQHQPPEVAQPGTPAAEAAPADDEMHGPLGLPAARAGSGTAWLPDETEMRGHHGALRGFHLMLHYNLFGGFDYQGGASAASAPLSTNWVMGMAQRQVLGGELMGRAMLSLEPLTMSAEGYPLLLQTGESYRGQPLVDRQHPHDLFMETAIMYTRPIADTVALQLYGGPVGEPAVGPSAFPHRPSAAADPLAPLGHHWLDSTHITFGVVTAGVMTRAVKLEGSWFNGREPDEHRYDFDLRPFDSYAGRLSVNPDAHYSLQASYAYLNSPEALEPEISVRRYTVSASHGTRWGEGRRWASTVALGINDPSSGALTHGFLAETTLALGRLGTPFARFEHLFKEGGDFGLPAQGTVSISSLVLGYLYALPAVAALEPALGVRASGNLVDRALENRYGTRFPVGVMAYLRLAPATTM
jgi:hypothetical protein